jgi:hypothetical protein
MVERKMKTFLMAMTLVSTLTILQIHPALGQIGSDYSAQISPDRASSPAIPDLGESWDVGPQSGGDAYLAPAPTEPMDSGPAPMFGGYTQVQPASPAEPWMEPPESRFAQPFANPAFAAPGQMPELPSVGMAHGEFGRPVR